MVELIKEKLDLLKELEETPFPKAGVLIALKNFGEYKKDPHIIFTKRSSKLSSHPGEVSFPGGKFEEQDLNLLATAVRESDEEIGIKKLTLEHLGKLPYLISKHNIEVHPFIAALKEDQEFIANEEIESIFSVPVSYLKNNQNEKVIVGPSESMSKSKKNTIDPENIISQYGADAVRFFILADSPPEKDIQWSE